MHPRTIARATLIGLAAALSLSACTNNDPTETPTPPPATTTQPTETNGPSPEPTFDPVTGEPAPPLPDSFGEWTANPTTSTEGTYRYENQTTDAAVTAFVWVYTTKEEVQQDMTDSAPIGDWLCGQRPDDSNIYCTANAWDGTVQLMSQDLTAEELASVGDELLAGWE